MKKVEFFRVFVSALLALLMAYSVTLVIVECRYGQEFVRGYFSDISSGKDFPLLSSALFGINTTITVSMLTGVALLFLVSLGGAAHIGDSRRRLIFAWSQVFFFLYVACDERLLIHERLGQLLQIQDTLILAAIGGLELALLFGPGRLLHQPWRLKVWLVPMAVCYGMMLVVDGWFPPLMPARLAIEDLLKTWAIVFLLAYAWRYCMNEIQIARKRSALST